MFSFVFVLNLQRWLVFDDHEIGNIRSTYAVVAIEASNKFHGAQEKILLSNAFRFSLSLSVSTLCASIRLKEEAGYFFLRFFMFAWAENRQGKKGLPKDEELISHLRKCSSTDIFEEKERKKNCCFIYSRSLNSSYFVFGCQLTGTRFHVQVPRFVSFHSSVQIVYI